jgi:hypothetical protein
MEKLTDTNYRIWKMRLELLFQYNKLWEVVLSEERNPLTFWLLMNSRTDLCAKMEILMHVSDGTSETLRKMETVHKMWEHLGKMTS